MTLEDVEVMAADNEEVFKAAGYKSKKKDRIHSVSDSEADGKNYKNREGKIFACFFCDSMTQLENDYAKHKEYIEKLKKIKGDKWKEVESPKDKAVCIVLNPAFIE